MFLVAFIYTSETKLRLYDKVQCRAGSASQTSNRRPNGISTECVIVVIAAKFLETARF